METVTLILIILNQNERFESGLYFIIIHLMASSKIFAWLFAKHKVRHLLNWIEGKCHPLYILF